MGPYRGRKDQLNAILSGDITSILPELNDPISPNHYKDGPPCLHCGKPIECIVIARHMNFNLGNALKYMWRAGKKDPTKLIEDTKKARWYLDDEIKRLEAEAAKE